MCPLLVHRTSHSPFSFSPFPLFSSFSACCSLFHPQAADSHKPNFRWIWTPVRTLPALLPTTPTMSCRRGNFDVATASGDKSGVKPRYARSSLRSTRGSPTTYRTGGGASNSPTTMPDIAIRNASGRGGSGSARSCSTITPRRGRENSTSAATSKTKRGNGDTLTDESDDGGRDSQDPAGKRRKGDAGRRTPDLCTRSASVSDGTTPSRSRQVSQHAMHLDRAIPHEHLPEVNLKSGVQRTVVKKSPCDEL